MVLIKKIKMFILLNWVPIHLRFIKKRCQNSLTSIKYTIIHIRVYIYNNMHYICDVFEINLRRQSFATELCN